MSVKSWFVAGMLLAINSTLFAKDKFVQFYPAFSIDSIMKKDAWAVCRDFHQEFEIQNYGKAVERVHVVFTILDKKGDDFAEIVLPYDKSSKVTSINGKSYNMLGLPDDKLKSSAIQDLNYTSAGAIYDDIRLKTATFNPDSYPYTVEYNYEIEYSGLIGYPEWRPVCGYRLSVEKSSFVLICPDTMKIRYREFHLPTNCRTEKHENRTKIFEWKLDSLKAFREEPLAPQLYLETPRVIVAPVYFIYDGSSGSMNSWNDFGKWIGKLNEGRDQLAMQRQNEIREMVKGLKDTVLIVQKLYQYMQSRTRYVAIQLGIGGYQPFPAETVDRLGYGDCKALSNYMKALLLTVGIPSIYTIAGTSYNQGITMADFPTIGQNNHAILCVPLHNDTLWLECTSQTAPCGYLGLSTAGRKVLNIGPDGGRIVSTPQFSASQNSQNCTASLQVSSNGSMQGSVKTTYSGYQYENISEILEEPKKEQEKALYKKLQIAGLIVSDFGYEARKAKIPSAVEKVAIIATSFASKIGTRLFIPLNIFNQKKTIPERLENRKMSVYKDFAYTDKDSVMIQLPEGFKMESLPRGKTISSDFGTYTTTITQNDDKVLYVRELVIIRGTWPKETYSSLVDFYSDIVSADKVKMVLKEELK